MRVRSNIDCADSGSGRGARREDAYAAVPRLRAAIVKRAPIAVWHHLVALVASLVISPASSMAAPDVVVVAARNSPISSLTVAQVADIFLGRSATLPGIGRVTPIDQAEGTAVRSEFYEKAARKDEAQLKAYWSRRIFTGKGEPPPAAESTAAVKRTVAENPHAIGYIPKSALDESVKPLLTIP